MHEWWWKVVGIFKSRIKQACPSHKQSQQLRKKLANSQSMDFNLYQYCISGWKDAIILTWTTTSVTHA
jgi:hypothetical protein